MPEERKKGLTGSTLKWIALITMLIDHIGAAVLEQSLLQASFSWSWYRFDLALRTVGRLAFPIYCFLLAEGFLHTRSRGRYLLRLLLFAVISEIPFDLAFSRAFFDWSYQNVYFTLALGFVSIWAFQKLTGGENPRLVPFWRGFGAVAVFIVAMGIAHLIHTDYGAMGVALVVIMYVTRRGGWVRALFVMLTLAMMLPFGSHWVELLGGLSLILIHFYNGERGKQPKWFFYVFYPTHLALLVLIRTLIWGGI